MGNVKPLQGGEQHWLRAGSIDTLCHCAIGEDHDGNAFAVDEDELCADCTTCGASWDDADPDCHECYERFGVRLLWPETD